MLCISVLRAYSPRKLIVGLQQEKVSPLLRLKYHDSIADAVKDFGKPEEIGQVFSRFQKYLYQQVP